MSTISTEDLMKQISFSPREVEAYQTSDGKLFIDEEKATRHQTDLIAVMADELVPVDDGGWMTYRARHRQVVKMLADPELRQKLVSMANALDHHKN